MVSVAAVVGALAFLLATEEGLPEGSCGQVAAGYPRLVLIAEGLGAYYRLNETAGTRVCDLRGTADGRLDGDYSLGAEGALLGDVDPGTRFEGSGSVRVRSSAEISPREELTLEAWAKPASPAVGGTLIHQDGRYTLAFADGRIVFRVGTTAGTFELVSARVNTSSFQHVAAVFDGQAMSIYRNGREIASRPAAGTLSATTSPLLLGSGPGEIGAYTGVLDEVAIYDAALTPGAIEDHYVAARPPAAESYLGCRFGDFHAGTWPDGCWRPYSTTSPFNQRLPAAPRVAADSDSVTARVVGFGPPQHLLAGLADTSEDYGHPTYYSEPGDPLFRLHCYQSSWGKCPIEGHEIRVPDAARATGGDGHLTVVDQRSGWEYDLYKVRSKPQGGGVLELRWGGRTRIDGDGLGSAGTAARFGNVAGIVRAAELEAGHIDHALFMTVHCDSGLVYPAQGVGRSCASLGLPTNDAPAMGTRFQLAMTADEIEALPVPDWKKTILHAMATYGMFVGDTGGSSWGLKIESGSTFTSFGVADPLATFAQTHGWTRDGKLWVGDLASDVDWARYLRVIDPCVTRRTC